MQFWNDLPVDNLIFCFLRLKRLWCPSAWQSLLAHWWPASTGGPGTWNGSWKPRPTRRARTSPQSKKPSRGPYQVLALQQQACVDTEACRGILLSAGSLPKYGCNSWRLCWAKDRSSIRSGAARTGTSTIWDAGVRAVSFTCCATTLVPKEICTLDWLVFSL